MKLHFCTSMAWLLACYNPFVAATYLCSETTFIQCQYLSAHNKLWKENIKPLSLSFIFNFFSHWIERATYGHYLLQAKHGTNYCKKKYNLVIA